jgi:RNA polymerase sigma-70 factor (ECF subfamily)
MVLIIDNWFVFFYFFLLRQEKDKKVLIGFDIFYKVAFIADSRQGKFDFFKFTNFSSVIRNMNQQEEIIWQGIQQKNNAIFERYYKEHYKSFFLMACRYLKDSGQASEIVNDVFMKLWQDGEEMRIESSLKSYIYKAIINRCLNALNKSKREGFHVELDKVQEDGYEMKQIEDNELMIKLYAAIDKLPEKCRQVFELSRFEELKQQEIADQLGISIKTVKNHITLALKQLNQAALKTLLFLVVILTNFFRH